MEKTHRQPIALEGTMDLIIIIIIIILHTVKPIFSSTYIQQVQKYVFKQNYYRLSPEITSLTLLYAC